MDEGYPGQTQVEEAFGHMAVEGHRVEVVDMEGKDPEGTEERVVVHKGYLKQNEEGVEVVHKEVVLGVQRLSQRSLDVSKKNKIKKTLK